MIQSETKVNQTQIQVVNTSLSPNIQTTSIDKGIVTDFRSTQSNRVVATNIYNNSKIKKRLYVTTGSDNTSEIINVSESGEYTIQFRDLDSNEISNETVNVLKGREIVSDLPESVNSIYSGQTLPIEISSTYNSTEIHLNKSKTNTTAATIELETPGEGETTFGLNTYAAANGSLNESVSVTGSGASIESVTAPGANETLSPGTYEIAVRSEQGIATTSDNATVTVARRSTNGLTTYTGADADRTDLGSAAAVRDAIESDALSESERVGVNDTVVYAVNATGLTGLPAARNATPETGVDLDRLDGIGFGVRSTGGDDALTASDALGETPRNSTVHVDETGLYVVADGDDALTTDGEPEPGEEFTAEFRVTDDRLREAASDPPDGHRVTSTVAFAAADRDDPTGDDRERIASGGPAGGGGGSGTGGSGGSGTDGGGAGTGGGTGDTTGGIPSSDSAEGDRPGGPNAGSAAGTDENGDRIDPARGVGFGSRPSAERRTPLLNGPIVVSTPTADGKAGASSGIDSTDATDATKVTEGGAPSVDAEASAARDDGSRTAGDGPDGSGDDTVGADRATPTYENAPIRATAEDVPGFGPLQSLAALTLALLAATRGRRGR